MQLPAGIPRADLGIRPTPVEPFLDWLVKREDLCHPEHGGNKARALQFLLAGSPRRVLTYSSLGAHHAYATALFARKVGAAADVILVRRGPRGPLADAVRGLAARVVETRGVPGALLATARLWRPGTRVIPPGGATPRGALGAAEALLEVGDLPPRVYAPLGTGATVSGLLAGAMLRGARVEIVAVRVADRAAGWPRLLWARARRAVALCRRHGLPPAPDGSGVALRVVAGGGAYGEPTPAALEAVDVARRAGLALEPTYTGKTLAVLLAERPPAALFWNTYAPRQKS